MHWFRFLVFAAVSVSAAQPAQQGSSALGESEWRLERREWTWSLGDAPRVKVTNELGDLRVRTHAAQELYLLVNWQLHRDDPRHLEVVTIEGPMGTSAVELTFRADEADLGGIAAEVWARRRADATVFVPARTRLELVGSEGLVESRGLEGPLTATTTRGDINVRARGSVTARTEHGAIQAHLLRTGAAFPVVAESVTGEIRVTFPANGRGEVTLRTRGEISTDFTLEVETAEAEALKRGRASIGGGGAPVRLSSDRGAIRLIRSAVPEGTRSAVPEGTEDPPDGGPNSADRSSSESR